MTVIGVPMEDLVAFGEKYGFKLQQNNPASFTLRPNPKSPNWQERYRQKSHDGGRKINAVSYYAHYLFYCQIYDRYPKAVVKTWVHTFTCLADLENAVKGEPLE